MAVIKHPQEIAVRVSHKRMFQALAVDSYTLLPKIMPGVVKKIDLLQGDGGVGIRQTTLSDGLIKHKIDAIDTENCTTKFSLIDGVWLGDKLESVDYEVTYGASSDGGCVVKIMNIYNTKANVAFTDEEIKAFEDKIEGFYRVVDEYLLADPNVCA